MRTGHASLSVFLILLYVFSFTVAFFPQTAEGLDVIVSGTWRFPYQPSFWSSSDPSMHSTPGSAVINVVNTGNTREQWGIEVRMQGSPLNSRPFYNEVCGSMPNAARISLWDFVASTSRFLYLPV